jgi:hypothetical protein
MNNWAEVASRLISPCYHHGETLRGRPVVQRILE